LRGPYPTTLPSSSDAPAAYREKIARVVDYVRAGEVYQLNLSQRFDGPCRYSGPEVARRLLKTNPSAFGGLVRLAGPSPAWLCSASPESFLDARGAAVATRPIKGTAPRGADDAEDLRLRAGLVASRKERAELAMIVDLLRNDLATTCEVGSVVVENPWTVETHPTVHHLTAVVRGRLREGADVFDLLRAAWPGGSISGCPKLRATELIDALESFRRGPYTGSLAAFSCEGRTRLNILIRSALVFDEGRARTWGGGGLTFESDPEAERLETLHKVRGVNEALGWETPS
jgi:para-aminobenzoate synthetase component I